MVRLPTAAHRCRLPLAIGPMPHAYQDKSRGIRLQKAMADAGVASRRDCEQAVTDGRVTVNGQRVARLPAWVDPVEDRVAVDGRPIARPRSTTARGRPRRRTYLMVNKPKGVISTTDDPGGRSTVIDLLQGAVRARLFPVGRLDSESTGLILLTDDGDLAARLTHPSHQVPKRYRVTVRGTMRDADLQPLRDGLFLTKGGPGGPEGPGDPGNEGTKQRGSKKGKGDRETTQRREGEKRPGASHSDPRPPGPSAPSSTTPPGPSPVKRASVESVAIVERATDRREKEGGRTILAVTLTEGHNREIRRLLARRGVKVRRLQRVAIGPVKLKGLALGQWRRLTRQEIHALRRAAGLA